MTSTAAHNAAIAAAARVVCHMCEIGVRRVRGRHRISGVSLPCRAAAIWALQKKEKQCPNR